MPQLDPWLAATFQRIIMPAISLKKFSVRPEVIIVFLLLGLSILGYLWLTHNFERKPFEVLQEMSPAAYNNRFLAAERYLQASGKQAQSIKGLERLAHLPSTQDAIFLNNLPAGLSQTLSDNLYNWVESGGHLLMVPSLLKNSNPNITDLTQRIGVRYADDQDNSDCGCPPDKDQQENDKKESPEPDDDHLLEPDSSAAKTVPPAAKTEEDTGYHPARRLMRITVDNYQLKLNQAGYRQLEDINNTASYRIDSSYFKEYTEEEDKNRPDQLKEVKLNNAWLLQYRIGSGLVTVLSDVDFIKNYSIGNLDHAFFFSNLVKNEEKIWLIYSSNVNSLFTILWQKTPLFWISLLPTLLLTIWLLQMYSGPKEKLIADHSHNVLAHIEASGHYWWRTDRCRQTVDQNRKHLLKLWQKKKHGIVGESNTTVINFPEITKKSPLSEQDVNNAFQLKHDTEQNLIRSSRALQKIRMEIQSGENKHND